MSRGRLAAAAGIAVAQLSHDRTRTVLAVLGVTLAVLSTILLAGIGIGVIETGQERFDSAGRDLWITGGPVQFAPTQVGGIRNSVYDSHALAAELAQRDDIRTAAPLLFQTVYVSADGEQFETVGGMGVPGSGGVAITEGRGFANDSHYAGGTYDAPMTREVLLDSRTADLLGAEVGDTIHVGGTIAAARNTEFEVVGISPTGGQFLGAPTVTMPLSELQTVTGKTATDPATLVTIKAADGTVAERLERRLAAEYPGLTVRTNREQLRATLERQAVVLAGGATLIVLAVIAGLALALNILFSMVYQQQQAYGALRALGSSAWTVGGTVLVQALVVGLLGAGTGLLLVIPLARGLNAVALRITGFEDVIRLTPQVFALGVGVAIVMSICSGLVASWWLVRTDPIRLLRE